jgi:predicted  nucleic acid-binding Zn-ribbon protein
MKKSYSSLKAAAQALQSKGYKQRAKLSCLQDTQSEYNKQINDLKSEIEDKKPHENISVLLQEIRKMQQSLVIVSREIEKLNLKNG